MAAVACLRVLADEADGLHPEGLVGVVAKLTGAFLETRWVWPRRHGRVGASAFVLADPRALEFDAGELRDLARELQTKLFGVEAAGEVCLLLFEGEQAEIMRFAACEAQTLKDALEGEAVAPPLLGRIRRVTSAGVETVVHSGDPEAQAAAEDSAGSVVTPEELLERVQAAGPPPAVPASAGPAAGYHAVYYAPRLKVIGSKVSDARLGASSLRGIFGNSGHLQDEAARRYDADCLEAALPVLKDPFGGLLFFPIGFSSIVHRPTRELYLPLLAQLPAARRKQLAVSVYDVPRDPSFTAMSQLTAFLGTYFSFVDLGVTDPGFRVEKMATGVVDSVTLVVAETDQKARLAAIRRFTDSHENYRRQKIRTGVSHIRTKAELDFCLARGARFLSGPAVSDLLDAPAESGALVPTELPLRRDGHAPLAECA